MRSLKQLLHCIETDNQLMAMYWLGCASGMMAHNSVEYLSMYIQNIKKKNVRAENKEMVILHVKKWIAANQRG